MINTQVILTVYTTYCICFVRGSIVCRGVFCCLWVKAGYTLDAGLARCQLHIMSNLGFKDTMISWGLYTIYMLRYIQHADQLSPVPGFEPVTFQSAANLLYPLSYNHPVSEQ